MVSYGNSGYSDICGKLGDKIAEYKNAIEVSAANEKKKIGYMQRISTYKELINNYKKVIAELQIILADIYTYLADRKEQGNAAIEAALLSASHVVPDSMGGIKLKIDGKEAWLEDADGYLIEKTEGGGFRATCSLFMRGVALSTHSDYLQTLILDELLAKLSAESSATVSAYLPILAQNMQIIVIEQKKEVYSNINNYLLYSFFLNERTTVVEKEEIANE